MQWKHIPKKNRFANCAKYAPYDASGSFRYRVSLCKAISDDAPTLGVYDNMNVIG
jgi:hypothetical protein